jgi:hypothetical protein
VVGTVVGADVGIDAVGDTVSCDVVGTVGGADVGIDEVGDTVGCDVVGTAMGAEVGIGEVGETADATWWEQQWARTSGSVRSVKQKSVTW